MNGKKYKILARNENCVLLEKKESFGAGLYKVRDIENDDVYMSYDYNSALSFFNSYDINKVRQEKNRIFEEWLTQFAE